MYVCICKRNERYTSGRIKNYLVPSSAWRRGQTRFVELCLGTNCAIYFMKEYIDFEYDGGL